MTREEAIKTITAFVENYASGNDLDGMKMAIETIELSFNALEEKNERYARLIDEATEMLKETNRLYRKSPSVESVDE